MEAHTAALEIVCKYFKEEYGTECMAQLKREKNRLASQNYRLRKKIEQMHTRIDGLMSQNDRLFFMQRKQQIQMAKAREILWPTS